MTPVVGLAVTLRVRIAARESTHANGIVDPARVVSLFGDVAAELMIRHDGDEGVLRGYQQVEVLAPILAGDYIEATGVITKVAGTTRQIAFEARKVITRARSGNAAGTAADALSQPVVVCRAFGTCVVAKSHQRHPRLVLPALPGVILARQGALPEGHAVITPPSSVIVTPPRETPPYVVIGASLLGGGVTRDHTPHIPVTLEEVAQEAKRCHDAGASLMHLGLDPGAVRDGDLGRYAKDLVDAIRAACDVVIAVSAVFPGTADVRVRGAPIDSGADFIGMVTGSCNFGDGVVQAPRQGIRHLAQTLNERGARALCECFDVGHIDEALGLMRDRLVARPALFQVVFGVPGALGASDESLRFVSQRMPPDAVWFAAGVGRHQRRVTELAMRLGANVRVGLADNIYLRRGELAQGSAPFVERSAAFARSIGREPADAHRARLLLGLQSDTAVEPIDLERGEAAEGPGDRREAPPTDSEGSDKTEPST